MKPVDEEELLRKKGFLGPVPKVQHDGRYQDEFLILNRKAPKAFD